MSDCFVKLADVKKILCDSCQEECEKTTCDYQTVLSELREKAVDAESVRHGHWGKYGIDIPEHPWHCSECGWSDHHIEQRRIQEFNACPNCRAKMDEVI